MAGSNGSPAQRGGQAPQWSNESEEQARALELERWHQQQAQQRGWPPPQQGYPTQPDGYPAQGTGYPLPPAFEHGHPAHGYAHPGQPDHGQPSPRSPYDQQGYPDPSAGPRPLSQFAPQFERFTPPPAHGHEVHRDPHGRPAFDPGAFPPPPHDLPDPFDTHRAPSHGEAAHGYPVAQPPPFHGHSESRDPQNWDLSHYQAGQIPSGYAEPAGMRPPAQPDWHPQQPQGHDPNWHQPPPPHGYWQDPGQAHGQHAFEHGGQVPYGHHPSEPGFDARGPHDPGLDVDELDAPEEPRRGPSTVLVVGMLVGAIVVGGGLAFAYKQFAGGGRPSAKVAEIKRQTTPEKVRPTDPGGKTIEHSDKKFLNRLTADGGAASQRQSDIEGAAKKVSTIPIVVNRDGSLTPQPQAADAPSSGVPGLVLDGFGPPPVPAGAPQLRGATGPSPSMPPPQASRLPPPPPPPAVPKVADLPLPKVANVGAPVTASVPRAAPVRPSRPERDDLPAQRAAAGASGLGAAGAAPRRPVPSVGGNGYVAVLASKRNRQEALNTFADLHSQYPDILGSVTPDVREANLGDKGVWYRLIGGPPGSREAARGLCAKLKARGMKDCWPVAY